MKHSALFIIAALLLAPSFNGHRIYARHHDLPPKLLKVMESIAPQAHLVVDARDGEFFGGLINGQWLSADKAMSHLKEGETFRLYTLNGPLGTGVTGKPTKDSENRCDDLVEVKISPLPEGEQDIIAINGTWNAQPRLPKIQDPDQEEYRALVRGLVRAAGIAKPEIKIHEIVRVDLEGDGTEEVIISANSGESMKMFKGSFSVLLLRKIINGKAETITISKEYVAKESDPLYDSAISLHKVAAILDVNGDGVMEIVIATREYNAVGKFVYQVQGRRVKEVLGWSCGD